MLLRRHFLKGSGAVLALALAFFSTQALAKSPEVVRIGVQKYGTLIILKQLGTLETALAAKGVKVEWTEFPGGPQLLEALNVGSIDFGTTGEAPPVFAQAAGAPLLYVGAEPPAPDGEAILVPEDSPVKTVADLKGKKIALNKGSNVHNLLVNVLASENVAYTDITTVFLPPADARAAFEKGAVDAWAIWDPFLAAAQAATGARILRDGVGLVRNTQFYLSSRQLATDGPDIVKTILAEIAKADAWASKNQGEVAERLSPVTGIPVDVLKVALARLSYGVGPITPEVVAAQQTIADTFHKLGILPKPIVIRDAVWHLEPAS